MSDEGRSLLTDVPWGDVIGLPNLLAHHDADPEQVWVIAAVEVPRLAARLR